MATTEGKLPAKAYLKGIGHVRVLDYDGDDYFRVIDNHDVTRLVHRDRLIFKK